MCFKNFFKKPEPIPEPKPEPVITLPHPEEPPDYTRTLANVNLDDVLKSWMTQWNVPWENYNYWRDSIIINVTLGIPYPAQARGDNEGKRHLDVRPEFLNPGVIAHEQAHNSYALLSDAQKAEFSAVYNSIKATDAYIVLLYSKNTYGLSSDIEGHAECYRYIGIEKMPESLRPYYPKLK